LRRRLGRERRTGEWRAGRAADAPGDVGPLVEQALAACAGAGGEAPGEYLAVAGGEIVAAASAPGAARRAARLLGGGPVPVVVHRSLTMPPAAGRP
jgi:hypothetical protein